MPEFSEWKAATENWHTYKIKYYKGLGTSTSKEAKEYFTDMARHRIKFKYNSEQVIILLELEKSWLKPHIIFRNVEATFSLKILGGSLEDSLALLL